MGSRTPTTRSHLPQTNHKMTPLDLDLLATADADAQRGLRGRWRTLRRLVKRFLDPAVKSEVRIFCQNSGACGSHYIVDLLNDNKVDRVFHEKEPDLNEIGVAHYERPISTAKLVRILRYTRHNVFLEANNRLFSLSKELSVAFPNAKFIHLFRHPANAVRSAMSKPQVENYLKTNVRFAGSLAGQFSMRPLERFCHYWHNVNQRIFEDLMELEATGVPVIWLEFDQLISGQIQCLEEFIGHSIRSIQRPPSNVGAVRKEGKFEPPENWSDDDREVLDRICLPLFERLKSKTNQESIQTGASQERTDWPHDS